MCQHQIRRQRAWVDAPLVTVDGLSDAIAVCGAAQSYWPGVRVKERVCLVATESGSGRSTQTDSDYCVTLRSRREEGATTGNDRETRAPQSVSNDPEEVMSSISLEIRLRSDATRLAGESTTILVHVLSDSLVWGMGFTQSLEARWPECAASISRHRYQNRSRNVLGEVLWTQLAPNITLAHLVAERSRGGVSANLDQDALAHCLDEVAQRALAINATVHAPPIGTGLAGARWSEVEPLMRARLVERGIAVVIHCIGRQMPP